MLKGVSHRDLSEPVYNRLEMIIFCECFYLEVFFMFFGIRLFHSDNDWFMTCCILRHFPRSAMQKTSSVPFKITNPLD